MSFLYPFNVSISRTGTAFTTAGGLSNTTTVIVASAEASIQLKRDKGFGTPTAFPAPSNSSAPMPAWMIYIPLTAAITALGQEGIRDGDKIVDLADGREFKVDAAEFTPLMWQMACVPYKPDA